MKSKDDIVVTEIYSFEKHKELNLPLFDAKISAGFPSPADDYIDKRLDLNEFLIKHPAATFFVRVSGDSMIEAGIHSGDILVVDRAVEPGDNMVVVALLDGEFTVKRIKIIKKEFYLIPENPDFPPIKITPDMHFEVWGVVTYVIHPV